MKRPILLPALSLLLTLCILLTGCNRTTKPTSESPKVTAFSCAATGSYRGDTVGGNIQRTAAGLLTITLNEPQTLAGLTMSWNGDTLTLKMLGIEWSVDPNTIPQAALGMRILSALDAVVYGEGAGELTDDGRLKTTGVAGDAAFTLYSDPATGALLELDVPSEELTLTFSDFKTLS